jgi:hypothetical protein
LVSSIFRFFLLSCSFFQEEEKNSSVLRSRV